MFWSHKKLIGRVSCIGALSVLASLPLGCAASSIGMLGTPGTNVPRVNGQNLNRERIHFPEDIKGRPTLLLIAFHCEQQEEIDTWLGRLEEIKRALPDLNVLELPVLEPAHVVLKPYIEGGMRSGIVEPEARARTVTIYTNKRIFRRALGLGPQDRIYAVLADRDAAVIRVEEGPATDASVEAIIKACCDI